MKKLGYFNICVYVIKWCQRHKQTNALQLQFSDMIHCVCLQVTLLYKTLICTSSTIFDFWEFTECVL